MIIIKVYYKGVNMRNIMAVNVETDIQKWLRDYKKISGRSIEWVVNEALKDFIEKSNNIDHQNPKT